MEKKTTVNAGISATGALGVAFVVLKLTGVIKWRWLWVLCPFWIDLVVILVVFVIILTASVIGAIRHDKEKEGVMPSDER